MISKEAFLSLVLPPLAEGEYYCTVGIKATDSKDIVKQRFVSSVAGICVLADEMTAGEYNAFFAMAKYANNVDGRTTKNAVALKSFFVDVDCGPGKPFADLAAGMVALREFCKATGLPRPTIVKSGRGAHVYWVADTEMPRFEWSRHAERLKELCVEHKFDVDPAVTGEAARVLRIPETYHLKDPTNPILVEVLHVAEPVSYSKLAELLQPVDKSLGALDNALKIPLDPLTLALMGNTQSRFRTLLVRSVEGTGCAQIKNIYDNQATLEEPLWRAGLSIAHQCIDRDKAVHAISRKHPEYSPEVTERKAAETKGPYTCETFKKLAPALCEGCPHSITSPIQLGKEVAEAPEEASTVVGLEATTKENKEYVIPKYPFPFFRGKNGGVYVRSKDKEDNAVEELVYAYDFYVVKRMNDPDLGETILLRLHLPKDGVREFIMPLGVALSKEKFIAMIASYGMAVYGKKQESLLYYVVRSVEEMQNLVEADQSHRQFGWIEDESAIIVGDREIRATEVVYSPPSSPTLPNVPFFQVKGDFHTWKDIINHYGTPGMESRAFAFFMGFGTLLMRFTMLDGFLLNLMSKDSGSGKTTVLHAINSIYGRPKELLLSPKDTYNVRMQRMGVMQNLAVTMDEITNMPPDIMSQQVYDVTSGRAKNRLKQHDNAERHNNTKWQTGMIASSNRSIVDSLLSVKGFPDGELKRIMEVQVKFDSKDDPTWARAHFGRLKDNYGHAIEPYSQALIGQLPMVKAKLDEVQARIDSTVNVRNSERYWALMSSIAITGGAISKQLGLHDIPLKPVFSYATDLIVQSRERTKEYLHYSDDTLGTFLNKRFSEILVINGNTDKRTGLEHGPIKEPRGQVTSRYEPDTKMLFVATNAYRAECNRNMVNFEESLMPYKESGALVMHGKDTSKKKRLLAGTSAGGSSAISCLWFDTSKMVAFDEGPILDSST